MSNQIFEDIENDILKNAYFGPITEIQNQIKIIYAPVNANGEIICDYVKYGGSPQQLSDYLGCQTKFKDKFGMLSSHAAVQIVPLYSGEMIPKDMEEKSGAILSFDALEERKYPFVLVLFYYKKDCFGLNKYVVSVREIDSGSFSTVNLVLEKETSKYFAMKKIQIQDVQQQYSLQKHEARKQIISEFIIQQSIKHQNIAEIKEVIETDNHFYIIMCQGLGVENLYQYISKKNMANSFLTLKELLSISIQLCKAVKTVNDFGIILRDIKPQNFIICANNIKLFDFSIAIKSIQADSIIGTQCYIAPEVVNGQRYDKSIDIFSLGCSIYYLMTSTNAFLQNTVIDEPKLITGNRYPPEIIQICNKMLQKDPKSRPSIEEVINVIMSIRALDDESALIGTFTKVSSKYQYCKGRKIHQSGLIQHGEFKNGELYDFGNDFHFQVFLINHSQEIDWVKGNKILQLLNKFQKSVVNGFDELIENKICVKWFLLAFANMEVKLSAYMQNYQEFLNIEMEKNGQKNKIRYEGQIQNNISNGFGRCSFQNNVTYVGQWKNGQRIGKGLYVNGNDEQQQIIYVLDAKQYVIQEDDHLFDAKQYAIQEDDHLIIAIQKLKQMDRELNEIVTDQSIFCQQNQVAFYLGSVFNDDNKIPHDNGILIKEDGDILTGLFVNGGYSKDGDVYILSNYQYKGMIFGSSPENKRIPDGYGKYFNFNANVRLIGKFIMGNLDEEMYDDDELVEI